MAAEFNTISKKFYDQYINGAQFNQNLGVFSSRLTGNAGDLVKLVQEIEVTVQVNQEKANTIQYINTNDQTFGQFYSASIDWIQEGLYEGATIDITFDNVSVNGVVVGAITGKNNSRLNVVKSALVQAGIQDGEKRRDFVFKLASQFEYLTYKYGINPESQTNAKFISPLSGEEQAYYAYDITTSPTAMTWKGCNNGSNLGDVTIEYDSTSNYAQKFIVEHTFRIPFYTEGQQNNLKTECPPQSLTGSTSVKYSNGFYFGGTTNNTSAQFLDVGGRGEGSGNVGYYGQNFSGQQSLFSVENTAITNSLETGVLEATVINSVFFEITNPIAWAQGTKVIFTHSRLPTDNEYKTSDDSFVDEWLFSDIEQIVGAPAVSSGVFSNLTVASAQGGLVLEVNVDVDLTGVDQSRIGELTDYLLSATVANASLLDPQRIDKSSLVVSQEQYTKDPSNKTVISSWQPNIYEIWDFNTGSKEHTNFDGWDGDLLGLDFMFDVNLLSDVYLAGLDLYVVSYETATGDFFSLGKINIPLGDLLFTFDGTYEYQFVNQETDSSLELPNDLVDGKIVIKSVIPGVPTPFQTFEGSLVFEVPWQDWKENLSVPTDFIDDTKPNNNRNFKSSNYSGGGRDIRIMLRAGFKTKTPIVLGPGLTAIGISTYDMFSDGSSINPFDDNTGALSFTSAVTKYFNLAGEQIADLQENAVTKIKVEFTHTNGVIPLQQIQGFIAIEPLNNTGNRFQLSTDKVFTSIDNPLQPSNDVTPSNVNFVEIETVNNLITFICETKPDLLTPGTDYLVYGRPGNKS